MQKVTIIGGGLAGCESAFFLAERGFQVVMYEMRPSAMTPAHETKFLGELVCSNSLKSTAEDTSSGLLKSEMRLIGSVVLRAADKTSVPAGNALAVDRENFAAELDSIIRNHPNITVIEKEITEIPADRPCIIATGPLTSDAFAQQIKSRFGGGLYFFDAIAPVISKDSIDMSRAFFKSRWEKGDNDYLNIGMNKEQYEHFYNELVASDKVAFEDFEKLNVYEGCMPIEEMAARGIKTLTFGPFRPVGLRHPDTNEKYAAVLQMRMENKEGTAYNLVGCQTKMKISEQKRVFGLIPGLENAEFLRYGSIHRNTYIHAPKALDRCFRVKGDEQLYFAGQITGVEGYMESAASGLLAAFSLVNPDFKGFSELTALGALARHVSGELAENKKEYVPSNFHFGMVPQFEHRIRDKKEKKAAYAKRAIDALKADLEKL
ncbi:methylenetetrahydrofolate--tRNA-(uracil(54)-C(5))-methyltransferase (FADH(2)-oxidizing) TrmFO [Seleniivibrio woodruffii]|uniref:methylenetetrahydrofolate--tRNA-(uracil(54)- C(5))-methyltransferase (FADH(2)-oxidizing) TrmFO n=1 Tax=Seleniivibrio woodruffii TaxID=1078050 RepID=UPI0026F0DAAC|nr:methylenetetrahydrofolate--tRNA-(uracil(54)-C(5))-methyltransferase (FADH(2)-oxidizing) TrmFO [Seleniivibrio woodruffii]